MNLDRFICSQKIGDNYDIYEPREPVRRVIAQKSVLVKPYRGFVVPEETLIIEANHKPAMLEYLRVHHAISSETIYNDLYGVIQHQTVHEAAYDALYRGVILASTGNNEEAIQHYTDCIERNPEMASAYNRRADAYCDLGEYDSAISDYQKALMFNVRNADTHHNLGVSYAAKRDYHSAIRHYDQALQLKHDAYTHYYRFEALLFIGEWEKAKQAAIFMSLEGGDVVDLLHENYKDVSDFEQQNGVQLPDDIVELLGGREGDG